MASQGTSARLLDVGPRYRVLEALGEGSFGTVFRARVVGSEQEVALKALTRVKPAQLLRFKHEFRALSEVSHPNLVGLHELFEHERHWLIAMELVEGTDLLSWVRKGSRDCGFDELRLRRAFADVAQGLSALHAHGLVHRDLKPSNVRVTPEGKAMVLDFGLVTMSDDDLQSTQRNGAGTVAYMAPEQASGEKLSPAVDLYALGASLYEALTGKLPFEADTPFALMLRKANEEPPAPRQTVPQVPADLDALCTALLARNPKHRPSVEAVLDTLLGAAEATRARPAPSRASSASDELSIPFEGREAELEQLKQALARTHEGELSLVFIEGESGIGKSALVAEFVRRQLDQEPQTWVLSGRCYEHERVPYKAFDACVDALAKRLAKLAPEVCAAVLPRHSALLVELFPVLGAIKAFANRRAQGAPVEPSARRSEAFEVLASLLGKLAESRPLLLVIDDLQWADEESLRLLRHLVYERPPPVLIVATVRPGHELSPPVHGALEELRRAKQTQWLALHGLAQGAIEALARKVLGDDASHSAIHQIAYESEGHPMLLAELCYYAKAHGGPAQRLTLDAALGARLSTLTPPARQLLELLALCGRPHGEALFRSLGFAETFGDVLKELLAQRFARRSTAHTVAIAHDRVRAAVLDRQASAQQQDWHYRLAAALERSREGDPSELAEHWDRAGETARASQCYVEAAKQAREALAFDNAAEHYARAFALLGDDASPERGALLAQYGRALAGAGKSGEAALAFTQAADRLSGAERVRLQVLAAQHQIQSAQFEEGMRNARAVLKELAVPLPDSNRSALARIGWERGMLALRGTRVEVRRETEAWSRLQLDAMSGLIFPLLWTDFLPGTALNMVHLRRSLVLGDPSHAARALAQEGALRAMANDHVAAQPLFPMARDLAEQSQVPAALAFVLLAEGVAALMRGELELALARCLSSAELLVTSCPEEAWLLTNVRMTLCIVLERSGDFPQLATSFRSWFLEAQARGDVFAASALFGLGLGHVVFLMDDQADEAREMLGALMRPWSIRPLGFAQAGELFAQGTIYTYAGDARSHAWFRQRRAAHDRSFFLRRGEPHNVLLYARSNAALLALAQATGSGRTELLRESRALARGITLIGLGAIHRPLALAQLHAIEGNLDAARQGTLEALEISRARGEQFFAHNAAYLLGVFEAGERGRELREGALAFFEERGWKDPWRAATMFVPAARILEGEVDRRTKARALFLGRYRLSEPLAVADHDLLVDALDTRTGRTVTLRSIGGAVPGALGRVKDELRVLESVHHENLARPEGLYEHEGRLIVVLEQVPKQDFLGFVRPRNRLDEERLRATLFQALAALSALHDAGATHGELRAALLRVSEAGRVVVLGRGSSAVRADSDGQESVDLDYLAPEQLTSAEPSAAADMYALGTSLYQALTGQLPFIQLTSKAIREAKRRGRAVPPWALRIEVPSDLEELCLALLDRDPLLRPSAREAQERLIARRGGDEAARRARRARALASLAPPPITAAPPRGFVGRARELETVHAELTRAERGAQTLLCVQGEGGIGKTALINEALEQLAARAPHALVLRSRCYANEQLRFQAFDGVVDELTRVLSKLPQAELEALLPARTALLAQMFPVFASIPSIRGATKKGLPAEPSARRAAAIEAFVELLLRLSQRSLLVLVIDDLQWADAESFALMSVLLTERLNKRLAIIAMLRPGEARDQAVREALSQLLARPGVVSLGLEKLSDDDAHDLGRRLFGATIDDSELELAVRESAGHPLFLRELAQARGAGGSGSLDLEQVLIQRVNALAPEAHTLLELLALLARPCPAHVLERAAGLHQRFDDALRALLRAELVVRRGPSGFACFHDRLREVVVKHIASARVPIWYGQLAEALEAEPESDPAERARLWDAAGEGGRACVAYEQAGDQALEALSFATAQRLYARAMELARAAPDVSLARLLGQRARALVALGRSAEAAALFEQAAQHAAGAEAIRLKVSAAQHQIKSAQFDGGMRNACAVFKELAVPLPRGKASALTRIVWERGLLALRGTHVKVEKEIDGWEKLRLDAMAGLILPLLWADFLPGTALNMVHLRRAVTLGDPGHAARAIAQEGALHAMMGKHAAASPLFALAGELAEQSQLPAALAFVQLTEGVSALMRGQLDLALARCEASEELLLTSCPEEVWLLTNVRTAICLLLARSGDFPRLVKLFKRWFAEAQARKDVFATSALFGLGLGYVVFLMDDRVAEASEVLVRALEPWLSRPDGFAQASELFARGSIMLYRGGAEALYWHRERRDAYDSSFFLRQGETFLSMLYSRTTAALAAHAHVPAAERGAVLSEARAAVKAMKSGGLGDIFQPLARAQLSALAQRPEIAREAALRAMDEGRARGERFFAENAAYLLGVLEGGEGGRARCEAALAFFRERGWKDPWRAATLYAPATRELEGKIP